MAVIPIVRLLGSGVAAYLQLPGGWFLNNAGWLSGTEATLLIDTCATEARTAATTIAAGPHTSPGLFGYTRAFLPLPAASRLHGAMPPSSAGWSVG
ncbi:MAG: hypothetical protein JO272_00410 [Pseudonocardiales bacterium]|nr:hypothetical protein [Pseudonocardiales bacterium]